MSVANTFQPFSHNQCVLSYYPIEYRIVTLPGPDVPWARDGEGEHVLWGVQASRLSPLQTGRFPRQPQSHVHEQCLQDPQGKTASVKILVLHYTWLKLFIQSLLQSCLQGICCSPWRSVGLGLPLAYVRSPPSLSLSNKSEKSPKWCSIQAK